MKVLRRYWWAAAFLAGLAALAVFEAATGLLSGAKVLSTGLGLFALGLLLLAAASVAAVWLLRLLLRLEWAPLAVARTVVDEALRMRIAVAFVVLLLVLLAALPPALDPATPLRYRIQVCLSYGLGAAGFLLSLETIFLACGTLSLEVQDQRIFSVMSKPVGRGEYLLGKWLGIALLNAAFLGVAGLAIYGMARYLARLPAMNEHDRQAVDREILTARLAARPRPAQPVAQRVEQRLELLRRHAPEQLAEGEDKLRAQLRQQILAQWRSIGPAQGETYVFDGLAHARRRGQPVQLSFMVLTSKYVEGQTVNLGFLLNGRLHPVRAVTGLHQVLPVAPQEITEDGRLELTVLNTDPRDPGRSPQVSVAFPPGSGLEVLYEAGSFEANFARTVVIEWVKLGFLASLGLAAASCLGFPVACLLALAVFFAARVSGFVLGGLEYYGADFTSAGMKYFAAFVRAIVKALTWTLQHHSRFTPADEVADGRLVSWAELAACLGWVGLLWSGCTGLVGWLIFRARELGRVQV